jgi:hypothetical protein
LTARQRPAPTVRRKPAASVCGISITTALVIDAEFGYDLGLENWDRARP